MRGMRTVERGRESERRTLRGTGRRQRAPGVGGTGDSQSVGQWWALARLSLAYLDLMISRGERYLIAWRGGILLR